MSVEKQSAAIPYRWNAAQELEVLLVTSRRKGRWVLPKGSVRGRLPHASAAREALEEAGAVGIVERNPVGVYLQRKSTKAGQAVEIAIPAYPLFVNALLSTWPEMALRERQWMHWQKAAEVVTDKGLPAVLRAFGAQYGRGRTRNGNSESTL